MKTITTQRLSKTYPGGTRAVQEVTLSVEQGAIFGFLGPNGAGKTTTVKLLSGMLRPTAGVCRVLETDPHLQPEILHQRIGVLTEHAQMYDHLTGLENLLFYGALFGLSQDRARQRAALALERLGLCEAAGRPLSGYSTGMRQRLSLARAILHEPQVLFLDEPTSGLDPESAQSVNALLRQLAAGGTTVFLCTHQLRYAQELCTAYGLMDRGRLLAEGTVEQLRALVSQGLRVYLRASRLPPGLPFRQEGDGGVCLCVPSREDIPRLVREIVRCGGDVYHVSAQEPTLEEIYFSLIKGGRTQQKEGTP